MTALDLITATVEPGNAGLQRFDREFRRQPKEVRIDGVVWEQVFVDYEPGSTADLRYRTQLPQGTSLDADFSADADDVHGVYFWMAKTLWRPGVANSIKHDIDGHLKLNTGWLHTELHKAWEWSRQHIATATVEPGSGDVVSVVLDVAEHDFQNDTSQDESTSNNVHTGVVTLQGSACIDVFVRSKSGRFMELELKCGRRSLLETAEARVGTWLLVPGNTKKLLTALLSVAEDAPHFGPTANRVGPEDIEHVKAMLRI